MEAGRRAEVRVAVTILILMFASGSMPSSAADVKESDHIAATDVLSPRTAFAVASYLPEWRYEGANWDTICQYSTHLILFSLEVGPGGEITALDRLPRADLLELAREAATRHRTALLICFGGNGRSAGFSGMVRNSAHRAAFIRNLVALCDKHGFDGVDYNWEYPGYSFRGGYMAEPEVKADYQGLFALLRETRQAFQRSPTPRLITMAYYPDGKQEALLAQGGAALSVDLMHMMTYDQSGGHHSTYSFAKKAGKQGANILPGAKLTLGVPFYGRHSRTGDWTTYEDLVQKYHPLKPRKDRVPTEVPHEFIGFNGVDTIYNKTKLAARLNLAGVMIWEVGQDCRLEPVIHGTTTHIRTCPHDNSSLLVALHRAMRKSKRDRYRHGLSQKGANPEL